MKQTVGFALCGSFCTYRKTIDALRALAEDYTVIPIFSEAGYTVDTRFGTAADFRDEVEAICGAKALHTLAEVEPFGPKKLLDLLMLEKQTRMNITKQIAATTISAAGL